MSTNRLPLSQDAAFCRHHSRRRLGIGTFRALHIPRDGLRPNRSWLLTDSLRRAFLHGQDPLLSFAAKGSCIAQLDLNPISPGASDALMA